jgi:probable HAF family extracellular repeat protein
MKSRILTRMAATWLVVVSMSSWLLSQNQAQPQNHIRYRVYTLANLGGTFGSGNGINDLGWVTGASGTTNDVSQEAALWLYGLTLPLGTLGGPNSSVPFPITDDRGVIAGMSDLSKTDPNSENFCAFSSGFECAAFWWENGTMTGLPTTLGGNNSRAAGADDFNHVVGWAETGMVDSTCIPPAVLQYVPVVWNIKTGNLLQLPTLSGDPDGAAVAINEHDQVVGISGPCADDDGLGARHAVLWQDGTVTNLGNFGGQYFNTAAAINNQGVVAGWSDVANDTGLCTPNCYGFVWTQQKGLTKILPLSGDVNTLAYGINEANQVVGQSIDAAGNSRAFIWQNGKTVDLNSLTLPGSPYLFFAGDINGRGEVTGEIFDQSTGQLGAAFLAVPVPDDNSDGPGNSQKVMFPESVRQQIREHLGSRGWARSAGTQ